MIPEFTDGFFKINSQYGFLPIHDPLERLSSIYDSIQNLLDTLPDRIRHLQQEQLEQGIENLGNFLEKIQQENDIFLIAALYRSYCFLSSAYLLFPSHVHNVLKNVDNENKQYGRAYSTLPKQLAEPLLYLADRLHVFPWLEYSFGYSLGNYVRIDPSGGLDYTNLRMANRFIGTSDETGFIMVHVDINQHTPQLIESCNQVLDAWGVENPRSALDFVDSVLKCMNESRKKMWTASRWEHYNDFRVFIMGIQGNKQLFPEGVIYEPENKPRFYRGQSGSQDTIIPFLDNFFRVLDFYPNNDLTRYLFDMRQYRPKPFRDLLEWVSDHTKNIIPWILSHDDCWPVLFSIYREIYFFRNGHWQFVQKYIMANTKYPIATGGTPITTWLPNQITAVLYASRHVLDSVPVDKRTVQWIEYDIEIIERMELVQKQVNILLDPEYNVEKILNTNKVPNG